MIETGIMLVTAGYFEAPGALAFGLGSVAGTLQPFNPQPVTIVFCNMDNLTLMKASVPTHCCLSSHSLFPAVSLSCMHSCLHE